MASAGKKAAQTKPIVCPKCGDVEMNKHAAKVVEPRSAEEAAKTDQALGGVIAEVHTCSECGYTQSFRGR